MKPSFHPRLVNGPFGDPGLLVSVPPLGCSLLFDLGRIDRTPAAELLKIRHVFVSHTHMDHFIGFDHLLRLFLARQAAVDLFGPAGIVDNVLGKLRGYTWNLVGGYPFVLTVHEVSSDAISSVRLPASAAFAPQPIGERRFDGTLLRLEGFEVRAALLDHRIDSLGFAFEEDVRLNVRTDVLERLGVPPGPWLNALKSAVRQDRPSDTPIVATWRTADGPAERRFTVGELRAELLIEAAGQKVAYVTDTLFSKPNAEKIVELVRGADTFYCESLMVDADRDQALKRYHLTARQAGTLARRAGVKRLETFHFSPRYDGDADRLRSEAEAAFSGALEPDDPV